MKIEQPSALSHRGLGWAHGALSVQSLGAMMAPLILLLPDGRQVAPLHVAPWAGEAASQALPGILQRLRGDWPCAPFGFSVSSEGFPPDWAASMGPAADDEEVHGHCSNHHWSWSASDPDSLALSLDYPVGSPIERVERIVRPDPKAPAVDLEFTIRVRRACRLPIGLHPVFRLPLTPGAARLELGAFSVGRTYPGIVEPGAQLFKPNRTFRDITAVPAITGGAIDASRLPFGADVEELLQIEGLSGSVALANFDEGYRARLSWRVEDFPSLLLWISNRGRKFAPWNGRHFALGVEPICSPFGLGPATATADNPIAASGVPTAQSFQQGRSFTTRYRIEAEPPRDPVLNKLNYARHRCFGFICLNEVEVALRAWRAQIRN